MEMFLEGRGWGMGRGLGYRKAARASLGSCGPKQGKKKAWPAGGRGGGGLIRAGFDSGLWACTQTDGKSSARSAIRLRRSP